jgi:hypothetical protein
MRHRLHNTPHKKEQRKIDAGVKNAQPSAVIVGTWKTMANSAIVIIDQENPGPPKILIQL